MERLTLDRQGARRGDLLAASLQFGDDTIAIQRIATMSIQDLTFQPWLTPGNQRLQSLYSTGFVVALFAAMAALGWYLLAGPGNNQLIALGIGAASLLGLILFGLQAVRIALRIKQHQAYFQLLIGTSDGRTSKLVDDNRHVLEEIRDIVRNKMDSNERAMTGTFDLELDRVEIKTAQSEAEEKLPAVDTAASAA